MAIVICGVAVSFVILTPIFSNLTEKILHVYSSISLPKSFNDSDYLVVLGGGLTRNEQQNIILNHYSRSRLDTVITEQHKRNRKIITSGVESPWMSDYLKSTLKNAIIINENASMNTCENAIFTAKLLEYHELPKTVYLVTDHYHIARARRQFANAGIQTIALPSPLSLQQSWLSPRQNLIHSRRAIYEIGALLRDIFRPQSNCRNWHEVSIEEISTPRRQPKIFS